MKICSKNKNIHAFTLIELSIVLVIISLIVGGIIGGKSLIQASEISRIIGEINQFHTAKNTFTLQYDALPGDMRDAYDYWGSACGSNAGDCNGDGNGDIDTIFEKRTFWNDLHNADILPLSGTTNAMINGSITKTSQAREQFSYFPTFTTWTFYDDGGSDYMTLHGAENIYAPSLTPKDAISIEKKIDDNNNRTGKVRFRNGELNGNYVTGCISGSGHGTGSVMPATTTITCLIGFHLD